MDGIVCGMEYELLSIVDRTIVYCVLVLLSLSTLSDLTGKATKLAIIIIQNAVC